MKLKYPKSLLTRIIFAFGFLLRTKDCLAGLTKMKLMKIKDEKMKKKNFPRLVAIIFKCMIKLPG